MAWASKTPEQRSFIVQYERGKNINYGYGGGGYLPEDCVECGVCGYPSLSSPCYMCVEKYLKATK